MIIEGTEAWADMLGKRGYGSAPKTAPMKRDWLKGIYPAPVYVATFSDGETVRMSFWNRRKRVTTKQLKITLAALIHLPELPVADQAAAARRLVAEARELIAA